MAGLAFLDRMGLNARERRLVGILLGVVGAMLFLGLPVATELWVRGRKAGADELRAAIAAVQDARPQVMERQARRAAIVRRYEKRAPSLAGYIEQTAGAQKLQVTDSVDRPELPHGKRYVERSTTIHFKKAGMAAIAKFTEAVERSGFPVSVTRLDVRKRTGEPDSYDVEMGLSAYDRNEPAAGEGKDGKDKKDEKTP